MSVYYSFHYDRDVFRVQQLQNMGVVETGDKLLGGQDWETVKRRGDAAIRAWIDTQMKYKTAVVVLIGKETSTRPWVQYEIARAWELKKPLIGINIHNLKDPHAARHSPPCYETHRYYYTDGTDMLGASPFASVSAINAVGQILIPVKDPSSWDAYNSIKTNLKTWVTQGYARS